MNRVARFLLAGVLTAWGNISVARDALPGGYRVWVMNSQEVYLADRNDALMLGPALEQLGVTGGFIVARCGKAAPGVHTTVRTEGYVLLDVSSGGIVAGLTREQAESRLRELGAALPELEPYRNYPLESTH